MLKELEDLSWLPAPVNWHDWQLATDKGVSVEECGVLLENVSDDKLARDVDDLSAIFEELNGELEAAAATAVAAKTVPEARSEWISDLDGDAMNVDEISDAFEALAAEQELLLNDCVDDVAGGCDGDAAADEESDYSDMEDEEVAQVQAVRIVPAAPSWASFAPVDPRSCIRTSVFANLDARIPRVNIPRMDMAFAVPNRVVPCAMSSNSRLSPKADKVKKVVDTHDPSTCWICKSNGTLERKRALHRYREKRARRNWKKGPRYSGRSHVASSRIRDGGRFICTAQWI